MSTSNNLFSITKPNCFTMEWEKLPFDFVSSIFWRGKIVHVQIKAYKTEFGSTRTITLLYDNQRYFVCLTLYKYFGGHHGDLPPRIYNFPFSLWIRLSLNSLELKDEAPNSADRISKLSEHSYMVLKTPRNISFNKMNKEDLINKSYTIVEFNNLSFQEKYNYVFGNSDMKFIACRPYYNHKYILFDAGTYFIEVSYSLYGNTISLKAMDQDDERLDFYIDYVKYLYTLS
jgi:hypothetical protein